MPAITSQNKDYFKGYLKRHKKRFDSNLQQINLSDLTNVFDQLDSNLTIGTQSVKVGLFTGKSSDTPLDISSLTSGEFLYLPAEPGDIILLKTGSIVNKIKYNGQNAFDYIRPDNTNASYTLNSPLTIGNKTITAKGFGGILLTVEDAPTYTITDNSTAIFGGVTEIVEGETITYTISTSGVSDGTAVAYTLDGSVSSNDFISSTSGYVYINNNQATLSLQSSFDVSNNENEYFKLQLRSGSITGPIIAEGEYVNLTDKNVTCSISESTTTIAEGSSITYTVTTTGLEDGTNLTFESSNTTDVSPSSGTITINNNTATFTVSASEDVYVESDETFTIDVKYYNAVLATSNTATIQNTTSYSFTTSATTINENNEVTFTINTTGIPNGTSLYYIASLNNIDVSPTTASFIINNNTASVTIKALQDLTVDDGEILTLNIRSGSTTVATTSAVSITDTPYTITVTPDQPFNLDESTVDTTVTTTFTVTTTGVGDGTTLNVIPSSGNNLDISVSPSTITINNNTATVTATITRDARTEGVETMNLQFNNTSGTTVITSPIITVADTSFVGSRQDNKTFGPITVNRDYGNNANASDWYTICGLDNIPDGGKISLFVDNSGSMTTDTVRASINQLLLRLQSRNISIVVVENSSEDWISSFDTPL